MTMTVLARPTDDPRTPATLSSAALLGVIEWLASDDCHDSDDAGLLAGLGRRLCAAGLPIDRLALHLRTLHPEILGRTVAWAPNESVEVRDREHGIETSIDFVKSPIRYAMDHNERLDVRLDRHDDRGWTMMDIYQKRGLIELMICPLNIAGGPMSVATFCTARRGGFTDAERVALERIVPALRNLCELRSLRKVELTLLDTYIGTATAQRVLAGQIRRGQVETLEAALMLCDLRGFTELSNRISSARVIEILDQYFDLVVPAITSAGGEIVKFMGDAVLAFFHREDAAAACMAALGASRVALENIRRSDVGEPLDAGIALHYGEVSYGNIGSGRRLDFTVIGPDVNLISRMQGVCSVSGNRLLGSGRFADLVGHHAASSIGTHRLRGFREPIELFRFAPAN